MLRLIRRSARAVEASALGLVLHRMQGHQGMTGDITRSTIEALAMLRERPMSAYKLGQTTAVHPTRAIKLLAIAAEQGFVEQCGTTRKGKPVYRWRAA